MNDDLISRQEAVDALSLGKEILSRVLDDMDVVGIDREKYSWGLRLIESNINDIEELPPAQPKQKWVWNKDSLTYKCTKCGFEYSPKGYEDGTIDFSYNYCPNCGCKMEKEIENF